jgi:hypothetical protein
VNSHRNSCDGEFSATHGHTVGGTTTRCYRAWDAMRQRCENPKTISYHNYGGRGIVVCERWRSFDNFLADMGVPPTEKHQLDRIRADGHYEPGNCRWATTREQARNKRTNVFLEFNGRRQTIADWAEELGVKVNTLVYRRLRGWSTERLLSQAIQDHRCGS